MLALEQWPHIVVAHQTTDVESAFLNWIIQVIQLSYSAETVALFFSAYQCQSKCFVQWLNVEKCIILKYHADITVLGSDGVIWCNNKLIINNNSTAGNSFIASIKTNSQVAQREDFNKGK